MAPSPTEGPGTSHRKTDQPAAMDATGRLHVSAGLWVAGGQPVVGILGRDEYGTTGRLRLTGRAMPTDDGTVSPTPMRPG